MPPYRKQQEKIKLDSTSTPQSSDNNKIARKGRIKNLERPVTRRSSHNLSFSLLRAPAMAISASSATVSSLTSDRTCTLVSSTRATASSLSKCSPLSSLQVQFPLHLRRQLRISSARSLSRSRVRVLPLVEAKKQTFSSFDELIKNSDKPVLVDFYATWCGPCQLMGPILDKASAALKDRVQVVKIDTEKYPAIANEYKIEALPTFILFKDGEPCDRFEGAMPADKLIQRIEASLAVKH